MRCGLHLRKEAIGYCSICGAFGCDDCMTLHEGSLYCRRHYKPIADKLNQTRKRAETRKRHGRHHLVVHYNDGRTERGVCLNLNVKETGFHLELVDENGINLEKAIQVRFDKIKAVFSVKSFDGKFDKNEKYNDYSTPGTDIFVKFKDSEVIRGMTTGTYDMDSGRFYLVPHDETTNNITILIERTAVEAVYTPEEYFAMKKAKEEVRKKPAKKESTELSQEETMGDFYFETHSYIAAAQHYKLAVKLFADSERIQKKFVVATINVGIQHIKKREYPKALVCMEEALEFDPDNRHAKKKSMQLRHIIEKTERRMREYKEQTEARKARAGRGESE